MLETSIGVTATLLGAMAITGEMGARRRHTVRTERWFVNAALILLLVLTIAARVTGRLTT